MYEIWFGCDAAALRYRESRQGESKRVAKNENVHPDCDLEIDIGFEGIY
jgi:hypothetical protein